MSSIIPNFEYDIFISYRHNDNRSGWVTEFVRALQEELAVTIKDPVSVYFDTNPHDGLLETHNVDKSLEGKLKCLIFIPIISQTYCDPKSFAWQHEFVAFNKLSQQDSLGRDIKLGNGNVASRILPIKIHDLDAEDKLIIENEIGGVLRAIEFIFKSSGVNRPLRFIEDHPQDNVNKTFYRDQVNKVANAIKEIIGAVKNPQRSGNNQPSLQPNQPNSKPFPNRKSILVTTALLLILVLGGYFLYPKFFKTDKNQQTEMLDKSIGVLPFTDISEAHDQGYFSDGMMVEIMDHLYKIENLRVIPRTSMVIYKDSNKPLKEIASELGVATLLEGSVRKVGSRIKISVQLIDGETETPLWQKTYEQDITDVFSVQSNVAQNVAASLKATITPEVKLRIESIPTANQNAYDYFLKGKDQYSQFWATWELGCLDKAITFYRKAIDLDGGFSNAYTGLGQIYWMLAHFSPNYTPEFWRLSKEYIEKGISLAPNEGWAYAELGVVQSLWDSDKEAALKSYQKAIALDPGNIEIHARYFFFLIRSENCEKAEKELQIIKTIDKSNPQTDYKVWLMMCKLDPTHPKNVDKQALESSVLYQLMKGDYKTVIARLDTTKFTNLSSLGEAYALSGNVEMAKKIIGQLKELSKKQHVPKCFLAAIHMALGEEDIAYQFLEEALQEREYEVRAIFSFSVALNKKRTDPRMRAFIERTWIPQK